MKVIVILLFLSLHINNIYTQENWELVQDRNEVKVYVSKIQESDYYAFKAVMSVNATEGEIIKILKNVNQYPDWFAYTASTKLINQTTNEQEFLMETDYPWPFSNECMVYRMEFLEMGERNWKINISGTKEDIHCKFSLEKAGGYILLEPDNEKIKITYYFHSEPSQNIPRWLINPNIHRMPYKTYISLRKKLGH